MFKFENIKTHS